MSPPKRREPLAGGSTAQSKTRTSDDTPRPTAAQAEPEHRNDRRRFLVWALMAGYIPPARMTERIIADVERMP